MIKKRIAGAVALATAASIALAGCGTDNNRDVKNVPNRTGYLKNYLNVDGQPNMIFACVHGVPVITTKRSGAGALHVITQPSVVKFCETQLAETGK